MIKKWEYYQTDENEVEKIKSDNNISELLAKVLVNRGFKEKKEIDKN